MGGPNENEVCQELVGLREFSSYLSDYHQFGPNEEKLKTTLAAKHLSRFKFDERHESR